VTDKPAGDTTMFTKTVLAAAIVIATASSAFAASKSTNPAHDVFVNGKYVGSDPDPTIRSTLARDPEAGR